MSFVLAMQRHFVAARTLAPDGSSASIAEPLHEAGEDHATIRNVFGSERYVDDVNTPVSPNALTILALQTSSVVQSVPVPSRSLPVSEIRTKLMASLGLESIALTAYLSNLHREGCNSYLWNDWDHQAFGPLSPEVVCSPR